jgi:hypothetical protein
MRFSVQEPVLGQVVWAVRSTGLGQPPDQSCVRGREDAEREDAELDAELEAVRSGEAWDDRL